MKLTGKSLCKFLVFSIVLFGEVIFPPEIYCASKRKKNSKNNAQEEIAVVSESEIPVQGDKNAAYPDSTGTKISIPKKKNQYFTKIDESILSDIENGSPSSIIKGLTALRKQDSEYKDNEKVLAYVGLEVLALVWPSETYSFEIPVIDFQSPYTGAIEFARKGFFDSSTGNTDFLTSILPALVLTNDQGLSDYDLDQCRNALDVAREYRKDSVLLDYLEGLYLMQKKAYSSAKQIFEKLYVMNHDVYEIAFLYSSIKYELQEYESSYEISQALLEKNPASMELLRLNAKITFALKYYDMAETYVGRGLQQMPNNLEFLLFRAKILMEKKDYIHAVTLLDMYARQNDTNAEYLLLRSRVQLDWSKNTALATETIEKTLSLYPDNQPALLLAARIASMTDAPVAGKYADELVSRILETDPDNEEALVYALNALERRSLWQSAYEISHRLALKETLSSDIVAKHVEICLQLGKTGEAVNTASKAYEQNPQDETVLQTYILAQIAGGNKNQSLTLINSLLETSSQKMKSYLYYRRSFLQGTEAASLSDLRNSLISNPRNSDALFRLYEIYFSKEDYKKAQYYLKQVVALNPNDSTFRKLNESLTKRLQ